MVLIPRHAWATPCAELSSWLALLGAARDRASLLNAIGYGPPAPAGDIDHELAVGVVQAARIARQPGHPTRAGDATVVLLSLRREAGAVTGERFDAAAYNDAWSEYRRMLRMLEPVQALMHERMTGEQAAAWERGAS